MTYRLVGLMSFVLLLSLAAFGFLMNHYQDQVMDELTHTVSAVGRAAINSFRTSAIGSEPTSPGGGIRENTGMGKRWPTRGDLAARASARLAFGWTSSLCRSTIPATGPRFVEAAAAGARGSPRRVGLADFDCCLPGFAGCTRSPSFLIGSVIVYLTQGQLC